MVTRIWLLLVVLAMFGASAGWAARAERLTPPVWPQTFSLSPGEKAEFGFYVTQPGPITVDVTWRSGQVAVALKNPANKSVASTPLGNGPVKLNYSPVETDMGSGSVRWFVSVSRPGIGRGDTVEGTISVRCPPVEMAKVQVAPPPPLQADTSTGLAMQQFQLGVTNKLQSYTKARLDQIATMSAQLRTRMAAASQISTGSNTQSRSTMSTTKKQSVVSAANLINSPLAGKAPSKMPGPYVPPQIQAVNPASGYQGQETVLKTKNIEPDKTRYEAWFTIAQGVTVQATIVSATAASYGADLKVLVPGVSGMNQNYPSGQVFVRDIMADATSDAVAFSYNAIPVPQITTFDPAESEPDKWVKVNGANFKSDDTITFIIDGKEQTVQRTYISPTQCTIKIPYYASKDTVDALVYPSGKFASVWVKGDIKDLYLKPTLASISSVSVTQGSPGDPVLVTGTGFRAPSEVHFIVSSGLDFKAKVDFQSDTQIMTSVPVITGVKNSYDGVMYVKTPAGSTDLRPFHFNPTIDHIQLKLTDFNLQNDTTFSKNMQLWPFLVGDGSALSNFITQQNDHGWTANENTIAGNHRAGWISGDRGDDFYFCSTILLNGWIVEDILFTRATPNGSDGANASIWEDRKGTPMPYIRVHWFDTPSYKKVNYFVTYIITGPKGVPYNKNQTPADEVSAMATAQTDWQSMGGASQNTGGSSTTSPN